MTLYKTETDISFNSLIDGDHFLQFYFVLHEKLIFCDWGPSRYSKIFLSFFRLWPFQIDRIKYTDHQYQIFLYISQVIRNVSGVFETQNNRFWA
jgi:hypothetical protein